MSYEFAVKNKKGIVLLLVFIVMVTLTAITVAFLYMTSIQLKGSGYDVVSSKALWLAEAGIQKAIWYLKTPTSSGGRGEDWITAGTTENLGDGSYTMVVERRDFVLATNGSLASASSSNPGDGYGSDYDAANAIDGDDSIYWKSLTQPSEANPEEIIVTFPYLLTLNKVRFLVPSSSQYTPKKYTWEVSPDNVTYTIVVSKDSNSIADVTDTFAAVSNVKYLKLKVATVGLVVPPQGSPDSPHVTIATLEAIGNKITSTGTVSVMNRKIAQTVVVDDATQTAADEIDWNEIIPAL